MVRWLAVQTLQTAGRGVVPLLKRRDGLLWICTASLGKTPRNNHSWTAAADHTDTLTAIRNVNDLD